ncbi:uncharacterized protein LOC126892908 isoform X2 [Diabrotica virgifera virgifera]|uniref:Uncharacterized protein n=1 Tax=Diabrotica virgifera virgifera TaxID=50390 RepID=A0ABM5L8F2_DIAVI|nr:uncharacterized protein LOC126892908 isoform X2 [Diabrotica virgifera virgifera]XP_050518721.1 uncharacterized protein LOC126892908 isoform X2 [Diabrotica virgifera virgifera]
MKYCFVICCSLLFIVGLSSEREHQDKNPDFSKSLSAISKKKENHSKNPDSLQSLLGISKKKKKFPKEKVIEIANKHLQTDEGFKAAVNYLKSVEWRNLTETIRKKPEWVSLKDYIKKFGISIDTIVKHVDKYLQTVTVRNLDENTPRNLTSFLLEAGDVLPRGYFLKLLFKELIKIPIVPLIIQLKSPEIKLKFDVALDIPEVHTVLVELKKMGAPLDVIIGMIYFFLGWEQFGL